MPVIRMIKTALACVMMMTTLSVMASGGDVEFRAKLIADCFFGVTSQPFTYGQVTAMQVINKTKVVSIEFPAATCSGGAVNASFYLTPASGSTTGTDVDNVKVLVPTGKNLGIRIGISFISSGTSEAPINLTYDTTAPVTFQNAPLGGWKLKLTTTLVPLQGKNQGGDIALGDFSAAATLNILYF